MPLIHNGHLRAADDPLLTPGDGLVVCGRGAFETIAAYRGVPFHPEAHFARLRRAAAALELRCPDDRAWRSALDAALAANGLQDAALARLRITLSSPADRSESWWVEATTPPPHPPEAKVVTGPFVRNELGPLAGLKTVSYGENAVALRAAREAGADEALFQNTRGELCEGTWSNLFLRAGGRWMTPPLGSGCLPGVTRALVIPLFRELGLEIAESTLSTGQTDRVEAGFLTSSLREIQPIASLDGRPLVAAPEIRVLQDRYRELVAASCGSARSN